MSPTARRRRGIATVSLSGTLDDKLDAAARAGFDGVEIFEGDLVTAPWSPGEVRRRLSELGLTADLYQPFRDYEAVAPATLAANLRRAEAKFDVMKRSAPPRCSCARTSPRMPSTTTTWPPSSCISSPPALRIAACGSPTRRSPGGATSREYDHSWRIVRARRPPRPRRLPGQLPHPLARDRPRDDRRDPGREDLLPAAGRRPAAADGRPAMEPALPLLPWPGRLRSRALPGRGAAVRATAGRCRWRSSTTSSAGRTPTAWRSTRCARCCCSRRPPTRGPGARRRARPPSTSRCRCPPRPLCVATRSRSSWSDPAQLGSHRGPAGGTGLHGRRPPSLQAGDALARRHGQRAGQRDRRRRPAHRGDRGRDRGSRAVGATGEGAAGPDARARARARRGRSRRPSPRPTRRPCSSVAPTPRTPRAGCGLRAAAVARPQRTARRWSPASITSRCRSPSTSSTRRRCSTARSSGWSCTTTASWPRPTGSCAVARRAAPTAAFAWR